MKEITVNRRKYTGAKNEINRYLAEKDVFMHKLHDNEN